MRRNSLLGFATIELPSGLTIADATVHVSRGRAWVGLPSRPMIDSSGIALPGDGGKIRYAPILSWRDRDLADRWSDAVVALVRAGHPGDFGDDGEPRSDGPASQPIRRGAAGRGADGLWRRVAP
jgi:hypothetical protein